MLGEDEEDAVDFSGEAGVCFVKVRLIIKAAKARATRNSLLVAPALTFHYNVANFKLFSLRAAAVLRFFVAATCWFGAG